MRGYICIFTHGRPRVSVLGACLEDSSRNFSSISGCVCAWKRSSRPVTRSVISVRREAAWARIRSNLRPSMCACACGWGMGYQNMVYHEGWCLLALRRHDSLGFSVSLKFVVGPDARLTGVEVTGRLGLCCRHVLDQLLVTWGWDPGKTLD